MVYQGSFRTSVIKQIIFNEDGKVSVKFTTGLTVHVVYEQPQAEFDVAYHSNHLNVDWKFRTDIYI